LHENIQSILSNEDGDASGSSAAPKLMSPAEPNPAASKGDILFFFVFYKHQITCPFVYRFYLQWN